jgi:hypothetical protein
MTYQRKTITALATVEKPVASLDADSLVALEWSQLWALNHAGVKPVPSVVMRRALCLLARHLSALPPDDGLHRAEALAFQQAGKGNGSARSLTEARARMEAHLEAPGRQPMASWLDALYSPKQRAEGRETAAAIEVHMAQLGANGVAL